MQSADTAKVLALIAAACASEEVLAERDVDLFEAGLLDSLAFVELLVGFEDTFGVVIPPTGIERGEVSTVNQILALLEEHLPS
jgi:D-alanine--poly(phosphoribitol) ligase subunit 2